MNSQLLFLLAIAMVAGVILFRLYSVLGRRTGHERPPRSPIACRAGPARRRRTMSCRCPPPSAPSRRTRRSAWPAGLPAISQADRNFDEDHFVAGARHAYELIVTAFAANDRNTLQPASERPKSMPPSMAS